MNFIQTFYKIHTNILGTFLQRSYEPFVFLLESTYEPNTKCYKLLKNLLQKCFLQSSYKIHTNSFENLTKFLQTS